MMGFENVVRPAVLPNIRPPDARAKPTAPADKGTATINGRPLRIIDLSYSYSFSASSSSTNEVEREVEEVRVYQKNDDGTINRENFIDLEIAGELRMEGHDGPDYGANPVYKAEAIIQEAQRQGQIRYIATDRYNTGPRSDNIEFRGKKMVTPETPLR